MNIRTVWKCMVGTLLVALWVPFGSFQVGANGIDGSSLGEHTFFQETNPHSLLLEEGSVGIQRGLLDKGVLRANIYQLIGKQDNEFSYGLAGDVQVGPYLLELTNSSVKPIDFINDADNPKYITLLKEYIISWERSHRDKVQFLGPSLAFSLGEMPHNKKLQLEGPFLYDPAKHAYYGVLKTHMNVDGVLYEEVVFLKMYDAPFFGPSVRFVVVHNKDIDRWGHEWIPLLHQ